jgi:hypothetical protein
MMALRPMPRPSGMGEARHMGWTIRRSGIEYVVAPAEEKRTAVLRADGDEVDAATAEYWESATLSHDDVTITIRWGPRNTILSCDLVDGEGRKTPLIPPPDSKAARREAFARERPTLFVVRRVGQAALEIIIGVLGIGALVSAFFGSLLPRLNLPRIPHPHWSAPDWLRYLDIAHWLGKLGLSWPDIGIPDWLDPVLEQKKYWLPLVIAAFIALGELDRRRKIDAERRRADEPGA